ncbi:AAA family ATPase, partial [Acinetobacter ursingii]|uniref:AAA family ATPase n=1 Tax=Acinetobacter ursingii TaxID=108980 RepID=UPI00124E9B5F
DNREKDFILKKDQGSSVPIRNTASGSKVFGILQLLSSNDFINKKSLLVFDEPENHLHPKWQLKLAEILIDLAEQGVYILVSSHSPYMIEALKRYSDLAGLEKESSFYLAKENSIQNKDKLEEIFQVLSEPFEVFRKMDREILKDE